MRADAIVFGIAGALFGIIVGWVLGSQQATTTARLAPAAQAAPAQQASQSAPQAAVIDPERVKALESLAAQNPNDVQPRVQLGNIFFDGEQYAQSITWYEQALKINPNDANVSTDLGVAYYYTNQPDKALAQFDQSLKLDPKHTKTILNVGVVKAFAKQDLQGAQAAWEQAIKIAPDSPEGQAAKKLLDSLRSAHPATGQKPGA